MLYQLHFHANKVVYKELRMFRPIEFIFEKLLIICYFLLAHRNNCASADTFYISNNRQFSSKFSRSLKICLKEFTQKFQKKNWLMNHVERRACIHTGLVASRQYTCWVELGELFPVYIPYRDLQARDNKSLKS